MESAISQQRWNSASGTATACGSRIVGWEPGSINPSEGLLLKFSGDLVYLVLIKGSNLDQPLKEGAVTLTHAGFQRHRLLWVREMTEEEIRHVGETEPTIDSIEVAEFESHAALKEWLSKKAPAFVR